MKINPCLLAIVGLLILVLPIGAMAETAMTGTGAPSRTQAVPDQKTDAPIVVELFTTSDCAACVFADRMLYDALKDKNVIGLSCHVNDLSELKTAGNAYGADGQTMDPCSFRQWTYAAGKNDSYVTLSYPTFVINGSDKLGPRSMSYFNNMVGYYHYYPKNKALPIILRWKNPHTITLYMPEKSGALNNPNTSASMWLFRYQDVAVQKIDEGVNKGKVLRFSNIVQSIKHIGKWHGESRAIDVEVSPAPGGEQTGGYAVIVSELMGSETLAAGKVADPVKDPAAEAKPQP